jgi:hypothetical protein|tara:strand:+ start:5265 stop:5843 length:579 start_codon:yes stop_codon:yes gene_type:complete
VVLAKRDFVTPPELAAVTTVFFDGEISLDPASSKHANTIIQARRYFSWEDNGLKQSWKSKNIYLYPPRDIALKNEQPRSKKLFSNEKYFKKSNQRVWLEVAYSKWMQQEFDEGIVFLTSTEVALLVTQKLKIDLPLCVLKERPKLLEDSIGLEPISHSRVYGFVLYLPSVKHYTERIHAFSQLYSDLGRVYV